MKMIPNCLSILRILFSLVLILFKPLSAAFYIIYILCGISDMLDGFIARKTGTASSLGAKLDSLADLVMITVLLVLLYPVINPAPEILVWVLIIAVIRLISMGVAFKKYRTFASLHTYGNKITGLALFVFPILMSFFDSTALTYVLCALAGISAVEELLIHLTSVQLRVNIPSIFSNRK